MTKVAELISSERSQYLVYAGLSIGILGLTGVLHFSDHLLFQRFIGRINPLIAFITISILGVILFTILLYRGWFAIIKKESLEGMLRYSGLAALFVIISILVDI